jgi:hypothetical protein
VAENETDGAAQEQDPAQEMESRDTTVGQIGEAGYAPSTVETNRARIQGGGVGQTDLDQQRDPTTRDSSEKY